MAIKLARPVPGTAATIARVVTKTTVVTLLAANAARLGWRLHNEAAVVLHVKYGSAATTTDYTAQVAAGTAYAPTDGYSGVVTGVLASGADSAAQCTEVTP